MKTLTCVLSLSSLLLLSGCLTDIEDEKETQEPEPLPVVRELKSINNHDLSEALKNGILNSWRNYNFIQPDIEPGVVNDSADFATDAEADGGSEPASETNLIEQGVDEADIIKFNSETSVLFIAKQNDWKYSESLENWEVIPATIEAVELTSAPSQNWLSRYYLDENTWFVEGLYSVGKEIVALSSASEHHGDWYSPWYWGDGFTSIENLDVSDATAIKSNWKVNIKGQIVDSRRIDDTLYLVTRHSPRPIHLPFYVEEDDREAYIQQLEEIDYETLLPTISINGQEQSLIDSCLFPESEEWEQRGYFIFTNITQIDLKNPENWSNQCALLPAHQVYANSDAIYLVNTDWHSELTSFHRFTIDENISYFNSVSASGVLGSGRNQFRLKEWDGNLLAVLTETDWDNTEDRFDHRIETWAIGEQDFEPLSVLPNDVHPEQIGKPNEDIRGVRIDDETVKLVTFEQTDPLYVFDYSDPKNPSMKGEGLEVTGFSAYLHNINESLFVGVGYEATDEGTITGVKVALYEDSVNGPVEVGDPIIYGSQWGYSPIFWDYHAFSYLDEEALQTSEFRMAFPFMAYDTDWEDTTGGLGTFTINTQTKTLVSSGVLEAENWCCYQDRSLLLGDSVHYIDGSSIVSSVWGSTDSPIVLNITEQQ